MVVILPIESLRRLRVAGCFLGPRLTENGLTRVRSAQRFRSLVFPTALPYLMTGIRLAAAVALILTITAQMFIGTPGIGRSIIFAQQGANWVQVYALIVVTGVLGLLVNIGFRAIERKVLGWHESVRGEEVL